MMRQEEHARTSPNPIMSTAVVQCCKYSRPSEACDEREKKMYNAGMVVADTMWCHHLDAKTGHHIVLNNLPTENCKQCQGVMYVGMGWTGKTITCGDMRANGSGHDRCHKGVCPYMRDGNECPFMVAASESVPNPKAIV